MNLISGSKITTSLTTDVLDHNPYFELLPTIEMEAAVLHMNPFRIYMFAFVWSGRYTCGSVSYFVVDLGTAACRRYDGCEGYGQT